jgi:hypothetical protein
MRGLACSLLLGALSVGCSWSRYDSITEDAPIVLLNRPKAVRDGFGSSLATLRGSDGATLLVGGAPLTSGGAEFALGSSGDAPVVEARDTGHCLGGPTACYFSETPVPWIRAAQSGGDRERCFVDGAGVAFTGDRGLIVRCLDHVELGLPVPPAADARIKFAVETPQPSPFRFATDSGAPSMLLASADEEPEVWFYPPGSKKFVVLPNPADAQRGRWEVHKRTLAVARIGDEGRLMAVGEPGAGSVRLFFAPDGLTPSYLGCLGGTPDFGRTLAVGPVVRGDSDDELVIADQSLVYVFDGARLAELPPTNETDCSLGALPAGALVTSFGCGSTKNISDCGSSDFGAALAVGDLDGDGDGEVVVGAPNMTVRHTKRAGALLIYDVERQTGAARRELYDFLDIAFLSSADEDDQLGRSVALPDLGDHQLLVAGAPGNGKAALFYCPSFLPAGLAGGRCK